jgi:hypothetical protein
MAIRSTKDNAINRVNDLMQRERESRRIMKEVEDVLELKRNKETLVEDVVCSCNGSSVMVTSVYGKLPYCSKCGLLQID